MAKYKKIEVPIYTGTAYMYVGDGDACSKHAAVEANIPDKLFEPSRVGACFLQDGCNNTGIWVREEDDVATIAHECLHASIFILGNAGISLTESSEEAYTYLLSYFVDEFSKKDGWKTVKKVKN